MLKYLETMESIQATFASQIITFSHIQGIYVQFSIAVYADFQCNQYGRKEMLLNEMTSHQTAFGRKVQSMNPVSMFSCVLRYNRHNSSQFNCMDPAELGRQ
jgi:hypothetical protein